MFLTIKNLIIKWKIFNIFCVALASFSIVYALISNLEKKHHKPIDYLPDNIDGIVDEKILRLSIADANIKHEKELIIQAIGEQWNGQKIEWFKNKNDIQTINGVTYETFGENNEFIKIFNNLNSFFDKNIKITASVANIITSCDILCIGKEQEQYVKDNLPVCLNNEEITIEESNDITIENLNNLFESKNSNSLKKELDVIINNEDLSEDIKKAKIQELAYSKRINLIDPIEFNHYKNEMIKNSYDEILTNNQITDEQKIQFINDYANKVDDFFLNIDQHVLLTNDSFALYAQQYLEDNVDFSKLDVKQQEEIGSFQKQNYIAVFMNQNQIIQKNNNLYYEDIFTNHPKNLTTIFNYKNTEWLSNFFTFNDYFDNDTNQLTDTIDENFQVFTKISNLELSSNEVNFDLEYLFYDIIKNEILNTKFDEETQINNIFNFTILIKDIEIPKTKTIDEFYSEHSFSLNKNYGWDNIAENYWDKLVSTNYNNTSLNFTSDLSNIGYDIYCKRGGWWGYSNWDVRNYETYAKKLITNVNVKNIDSLALSKINANKYTISQLINDKILNSFNWSIELYGAGYVYYDDFPAGETGYSFSYNRTLTKSRPAWTGKAIGNAADFDGAGDHIINWKVNIDENKVYLKNNGSQLYLSFGSDAISIENYFSGGKYTNGPANNFVEGSFNSYNQNSGLKIIPYEIDLINDNAEDLLLIDNAPYRHEDFNNFKINVLLNDIKFENNNNKYLKDNIPCGKVYYKLVIYDLSTNKSKIYNEVEDFLIKNITNEMILEQYQTLIFNSKVLCQNTEKLNAIDSVIIFQITSTLVIQTALIILQIIATIKLIVALIQAWSWMLAIYITFEIATLCHAIIQLSNVATDRFEALACIKEFIVLVLSLPLRFVPVGNLEPRLITNFQFSNNNDKYIDNLSTMNHYDFESIYDYYIKENLRISKKFHLSFKDIIDDIAYAIVTHISEIILTSIIKSSTTLSGICNPSNKFWTGSMILCALQTIVDMVSFLMIYFVDTRSDYIDFYFNLQRMFI